MVENKLNADKGNGGPSMTDGVTVEGDEGTYFSHLRNDILAAVPPSARRILSVGCGAGRTEAVLLKRGCSVTGIEMDSVAANRARLAGIKVLEGDVSAVFPALKGEEFDCLIYADVLEHIIDPVAVLREHVMLLQPGGCAIVSVPNFRHYSFLSDLMIRGCVQYVDAGICDRTHVRVTTRRMVQDWLSEVGLRSEYVDYRLSRRREKVLSLLSAHCLREFVARQVIVRGISLGESE